MKLIDFILCDDIRQELGNKVSLMGVYGDTIEFHVSPDMANIWPKPLRIGIFARVKIEGENISSFKLSMTYDGKTTELAMGNADPEKAKSQGIVTIAGVHHPILFYGKGTVQFHLNFLNNKNESIQMLSPEFGIEVKECVS